MEGKIDFQKSMIRKMKIISPSKKDLEWLGRLYIKSLVYGSKKLIQTLKYHGKNTFLITGNFKPAVIPLANDIGISEKTFIAMIYSLILWENIKASLLEITFQGMAVNLN